MSLQACHQCGIGFDMDFVQPAPFKKCPGCGVPLDHEGAEHTFAEAGNPSAPNDPQRKAQLEQLHADVDRHAAAAVTARAHGEVLAAAVKRSIAPAAKSDETTTA